MGKPQLIPQEVAEVVVIGHHGKAEAEYSRQIYTHGGIHLLHGGEHGSHRVDLLVVDASGFQLAPGGIPEHDGGDDAQEEHRRDLDIEDEHQAVIADGAAHKVADAGTHRLEHGIVSHVLTAAFRVADADEVGQGIDLQRAVEQAADGTGCQQHGNRPGCGKDRLAQGIAEVAEGDHLGIGLAVTHLAPEGSGEEGEEAHHREGNALDIGGGS